MEIAVGDGEVEIEMLEKMGQHGGVLAAADGKQEAGFLGVGHQCLQMLEKTGFHQSGSLEISTLSIRLWSISTTSIL